MSVPDRPLDLINVPPGTSRCTSTIIGEEDGYTYITVTTEVKIVLRDEADVEEFMDLGGMPDRSIIFPWAGEDGRGEGAR